MDTGLEGNEDYHLSVYWVPCRWHGFSEVGVKHKEKELRACCLEIYKDFVT